MPKETAMHRLLDRSADVSRDKDQARARAGAPRAQMSTAVPVNFVYR